ncbi:ABC transporter permease subunit [Phytohabitans houttuyneae]|uniref:ABC transporter permease n=1 Tax=Phytohabitans houttuyneae TaxID=1076126 RepID=A0A6V8KQX2_9ACTN|nr:ABC transporter permease subunit [Phytohabitans houttuyneae]GFJ84177.1 ABC transporter permease [Phytohabitans houttuyneae]
MPVALRAEWTKLWTLPGTAWLLLGAAVGTAGLGALAAAACSPGECGADPTRTSLTGIHIGQSVLAVLAVLVIGGEYATGMMRVTLAALPRRPAVLAAKAAVLAAVVLPAAAVAVPVAVLSADGPSPAGGGAVLRAAAGSVLYLLLVALLALGVTAVVRQPAAAIGAVLGLLYLFPIVAMSMSDEDWQRRLQKLGPMSAGQSIQATTGLDELPIGPWAGLGVLALWAAGALLVGALVLQARDA